MTHDDANLDAEIGHRAGVTVLASRLALDGECPGERW
jgi:hypothetical protein